MSKTLDQTAPAQVAGHISPDMPLLHLYSQHPAFAAAQPLQEHHFVSTLHALPNLRSILIALERLGLDPQKSRLFHKTYPYPAKAETLAWAEAHGYRTAPLEALTPTTLEEISTEVGDGHLLLAEDGGHAFTAICQHTPALLHRMVGMVEQTTKGARRIQDAVDSIGGELSLPVLSLPHSNVKKTIEPPHIARGVIRSIEAVLDETLGGLHRVAVLGCGVIGLEIAKQLALQCCRVRAFDPKPCTCGDSCGRFEITDTAVQAVEDAHIVIGTSGELSISEKVINHLAHRALVVSASSDRVELDFDYLQQLAVKVKPFHHRAFHDASGQPIRIGSTYRLAHNRHEVTLLNDGMPLNFIGLGGMNDRVADAILTEMVVACALVAAGRYKGQRGILCDAFNEIDAEFRISARFYEFQRAA